MSRLDDLFPDVTKMSAEELTDLVKTVRRDRKVSKRLKKKAAKRQAAVVTDKLKALLSQMTPEQRKEILSGKAGS